MKRRLGETRDSDSLDLLLDTLCNVFGGIVLIACLLAILPRQQMHPPLLPTHFAEAQMFERRIISANEQITRLQSEIDRLSKSADPLLAELQARRNSLKKLQERLESGIKERGDQELNEAEARALVARGDMKALEERLAELRLQRSKTEDIHAAVAEKIRFLEQRSETLREQAGKYAKGRIQAVRFPRERPANSSPFPIIIRHNAIYPLALGGKLLPNPAVTMIPLPGEDGFRASPAPGKGIRVPAEDLELLAALRSAVANKAYASLYLYPDSHEVFSDLREALAKAGLTYGLEFVDPGRDLFFSSEGSAPPEL
jgi:hypothetical protein